MSKIGLRRTTDRTFYTIDTVDYRFLSLGRAITWCEDQIGWTMEWTNEGNEWIAEGYKIREVPASIEFTKIAKDE